MSIKIGQINKLEVIRETDISYTLSDGENNVFLHFNQTPTPLNIGDKVSAFLYFDQKKRLCATLEKPLITTSKGGLVTVVDEAPSGVFVDIGIVKDILLSSDYLPHNSALWPKIDSKIYVILKEKTDQLVARLMLKNDLKKLDPLDVGVTVNGIINYLSPSGNGVITDDLHYVFIPKALMRKDYSLGDMITLKIIKINEDGGIIGSLIEQKELSMITDSNYILEKLKALGGMLPYGNLTDPDIIQRKLKMSKSAFKRATGHLYKQHLILIEDERIILIDK